MLSADNWPKATRTFINDNIKVKETIIFFMGCVQIFLLQICGF